MTVQEYLKEKPLLFDGAMGTYLVEKHPETVKRNCEFMNIEHPEWVQKIHEKYLNQYIFSKYSCITAAG